MDSKDCTEIEKTFKRLAIGVSECIRLLGFRKWLTMVVIQAVIYYGLRCHLMSVTQPDA